MDTDEPAILYDLTNLVYNCRNRTPTGIGRVDVRYARHVLDNYGGRCRFVVQRDDRVLPVPDALARRFVVQLERRWFQDTVADDAAMVSIRDDLEACLGMAGRDEARERHALNREETDFLFAMNFEDRMNYVSRVDIPNETTDEFHWVDRLPYPLMLTLFMFALASRPSFGLVTNLSRALHGILPSGKQSHKISTVDSNPGALQKLEDLNPENAVYVNISQDINLEIMSKCHSEFGWKSIFMFYDLIPVTHPEYFLKQDFGKHDARLRLCCRIGTDFIVISDTVRSHVLAFAGSGDDLDRSVHVARIGIEPKYIENAGRAANGHVDGAYFVILGTIEPRKNHALLLNVWRHLQACGVDPLPKLYVVGRRGWDVGNVINMLERTAIRHAVVELNDAPDDRIIALLKGARALLFPSFEEGWGMPMVEALTLKVPVICSDIPVFHETGQGIPDYIHPLDGLGWARSIEDYAADDSPARDAQCRRIDDFVPPRWQDHFAVLDRLLAHK